jgi:hypothetical protein
VPVFETAQKGGKAMAAITVFAHDLFESIAIVEPRIEVTIREATEFSFERAPLRMHWVRSTDSEGRNVLRIRWAKE